MITADKRYQVFVSSTYDDLQDERKEVMQALLELDCIPAGMELFPASSEDQWSLIKRVIDDCDYYVLIIGGRYGSVGPDGISYTQMEFEYALKTGKPIISFIHKNPASIPAGKSEQTDEGKTKLEEFKNLAEKKLVKFWETPAELGSVVSRSMVKLMKNFPAEGWVKAGSAVDEKSVKEIARLQEENAKLRKKIERIGVEAPEGTEMLANGYDEIWIDLTYQGWDRTQGRWNNLRGKVHLTWNRIFSLIAPAMLDESSEENLRIIINKELANHSEEYILLSRKKGYSDFRGVNITDESMGLIQVQLRALGYMVLSEKKHATSDKSTYWTLTPYGNKVIDQLLAVRKEDYTKLF